MIGIKWLIFSLGALWDGPVCDFFDFAFYCVVSVGAIIMGLGFLVFDLLVFPVEILLFLLWLIYKGRRR